jgi:hypothetical protein
MSRRTPNNSFNLPPDSISFVVALSDLLEFFMRAAG